MLNRSASLAMSTSVLKALPGKLDIKRHSPSILYISDTILPIYVRVSCVPLVWNGFQNDNTCRKSTLFPMSQSTLFIDKFVSKSLDFPIQQYNYTRLRLMRRGVIIVLASFYCHDRFVTLSFCDREGVLFVIEAIVWLLAVGTMAVLLTTD